MGNRAKAEVVVRVRPGHELRILKPLHVIAEVVAYLELFLVYPLVGGSEAVLDIGAELAREETFDGAAFFGEADEVDL